ncbi:MAG: cytochrome P450 [Alphaproteobacteria bacterium]|nr:cytochrome P450 [Alphaproteobacteria bacterium]
MAAPPRFDIDLAEIQRDPYPTYTELKARAPIAFVPSLNAIVMARHADISSCERKIKIFSSHQPGGLMNVLMGQNLMRKDGREHWAERNVIYPTVSRETVADTWRQRFQADADRLLDDLASKGGGDLVKDFALPLSGEALKAITGLENITYSEMDAWSQAMMDGISNYAGDPDIEARCHDATAKIDAAIDDMAPRLEADPNMSLLSMLLRSELPIESLRANIKLAISGGQNEPRDAIAGAAWALLTHPGQRVRVVSGEVPWLQVFEEYARWISPIGMSPRRCAQPFERNGVDFAPEQRVFFLFGAGNRDPEAFDAPDRFDIDRDTSNSIAFGAGPHFCAGAWASRALIADVALPTLFKRLPGLRLAPGQSTEFAGWVFRGPLSVPVEWDPGAAQDRSITA